MRPSRTRRLVAFADKREIRLPERVREIVEKVEAKARSMFAGFRAEGAGGITDVPESTSRLAETKAIQRYARATVDIAGMQEKGLPVLPHQKTAFARAGEALSKARNHGVEDLASAIERDPKLAREAAAGDMRGVSRAMAEEARVRADPALRAGRFLERWQTLSAERGDAQNGPAAQRMAIMVDDLRHDPALRMELERRAPELGLGGSGSRRSSRHLNVSSGSNASAVCNRIVVSACRESMNGGRRGRGCTGIRGLRAEMTLVRRAVERLTAERTELPDGPDYSETLGVISHNSPRSGSGSMPGEQPSAGAHARKAQPPDREAGVAGRSEDRRVIAAARQTIEEIATKLGRQLESHLMAGEQKRRERRL